MRLPIFLQIQAVLAILHGIGFIVMPAMLLDTYQVPVAPGAVLMGQLFGAALLFVALVAWYGSKLSDAAALSGIVIAGFVASAAGAIITAMAIASGIFGPMGWLALAIYGLLGLGYLYFLAQPAKRTA